MNRRSAALRSVGIASALALLLTGCSTAVSGSPVPDQRAIAEIAAGREAQQIEDALDANFLAMLEDHGIFQEVADETAVGRGRLVCDRVRSREDRMYILKGLMAQYGDFEGIMLMNDAMETYCPEEMGPK